VVIEKSVIDLAPGEEGEIIALGGGPGFQSRLRALGLAEGQRVRNVSRIGWGGPVILLINRAQVAIGRGMARKITVRTDDHV
jgi:ferrous iron transport protein A